MNSIEKAKNGYMVNNSNLNIDLLYHKVNSYENSKSLDTIKREKYLNQLGIELNKIYNNKNLDEEEKEEIIKNLNKFLPGIFDNHRTKKLAKKIEKFWLDGGGN